MKGFLASILMIGFYSNALAQQDAFDQMFQAQIQQMRKRFEKFDKMMDQQMKLGTIGQFKGLQAGGVLFSERREKGKIFVDIQGSNIDPKTVKIVIEDGLIQVSGERKIENVHQAHQGQGRSVYISRFSNGHQVPKDAIEQSADIKSTKSGFTVIFNQNIL